MNNTCDLADLIFTGKTSDIPAPQIYRVALRWTLKFSKAKGQFRPIIWFRPKGTVAVLESSEL